MPLTTQKDEQAAEQLSKTLKQVMDGVKSQAGHIRGTVAQLEEERDRAIDARNDAKREVEVGQRSFIRDACASRDGESNSMAPMQQCQPRKGLRITRLFRRLPGLSLSATTRCTVCFPIVTFQPPVHSLSDSRYTDGGGLRLDWPTSCRWMLPVCCVSV